MLSGETPTSHPIRVLYVDDEPLQLRVTKQFVEELDESIVIETVNTPKEVLRLIDIDHFDCILSDYQMPDVNGIELAQKIRAKSDVPIIIYTGRGSEEVAEKAFGAGIDDYIRKELDPSHYRIIVKRIKHVVERQRARSALLQSEDKYKTLVTHSTQAILVLQDGHLKFVNPKGIEISGFLEEELLMKPFSEFVHPLDRKMVVDSFKKRLMGEDVPEQYSYRIETRDGEIKWLKMNAVLIDWQGRPATLNFINDITDEKRTEEALLETEERYETIFEGSKDAIFITGSDSTFVKVNRAACLLTGYSEAELWEMSIPDLHDDMGLRAYAMYFDRIMTGESITSIADILRKDGVKVPTEFSNSRIEIGSVHYMHTVARDISERKEYEQKMEAIHDHASRLMKVSNVQEICDNILDALESTLGFDFMSFLVVEKDMLKTLGTRGGSSHDETLHLNGKGISVEAAKEGRPVLVNYVQNDPDSIQGTFESKSELAVPVMVDGEAFAVLTAESPRPEAFTEEDLKLMEILAMHVSSAMNKRKHFEILEREVEEKTTKLLNARQLIIAGRVASAVGHDLRTPMQTIKHAVSMMKNVPKTSDEMVEIIENSVNRAVDMLSQFREKTRHEPLQLEKTDVTELIQETFREIQIPSNIEIKLELEKITETVLLDRAKIRRVLDNLIGNAIEAMPEGGSVTVRTELNSRELILKVSDTGVGFSSKVKDSLFQPFYTTKLTGLGLGLMYCKFTVEAHGGKIWAESGAEKGATFNVMLPLLM